MYIVFNERKLHRKIFILKSTCIPHLDTGKKIEIWQNIKSGKKPLRMNRLKVTMSVLLIILSKINFLFSYDDFVESSYLYFSSKILEYTLILHMKINIAIFVCVLRI